MMRINLLGIEKPTFRAPVAFTAAKQGLSLGIALLVAALAVGIPYKILSGQIAEIQSELETEKAEERRLAGIQAQIRQYQMQQQQHEVAASENRTRAMTLGVSRTTSSSTGASRKADANRKSQAAPSTKSRNSGPLFVVKVIELLENGTTKIKIETSRPAPYKVLRLSNPPRLVVDLMGARSRVGRFRTFSTTSPFLERIRLAQFRDDPAVVRVVADLAGTPRYRVKAVDGGIQMRLGDSLEALNRAEGASSRPVASVEEAEPREISRASKAPSVAPAKTAVSSNQSSDKPESVPAPAPLTTPSSSAATAAAGDDAEHEPEIFSVPKPPISVASAESVPPAALVPGALGSAAPQIDTQSAQTKVLVPDGATLVFGGVAVQVQTKSVAKIPLLGDIPILGNLFKSTSVTDNDQEFIFLITPKIMPG